MGDPEIGRWEVSGRLYMAGVREQKYEGVILKRD
jgi:hypothetical protein